MVNNTVKPSARPLASGAVLTFVRRLKLINPKNCIHYIQSHAPFPSDCSPIHDHLKVAIKYTAEAGGPICSIHPASLSSIRENANMYCEVMPFAKNLRREDCILEYVDQCCLAFCATPQRLTEHLESVNEPDSAAWLDFGHAEMHGLGTSSAEMIRTIGPHLRALHIHDNDRCHNSYQIPFFDANFVCAHHSGNESHWLQGYFPLEVDKYLCAYTPETVTLGIAKLAEVVHRFEDLFWKL